MLFGTAARTQQQESCLHGANETPQESQRRVMALFAVRIINTAELMQHSKSGKYVSLAELGNSPAMERFTKMQGAWSETYKMMTFAPDKDIVPGFEARLTTDGKSYSIIVIDITDPCNYSFFSDEKGVIYTGQPLR
jgi:hypothetical protein